MDDLLLTRCPVCRARLTGHEEPHEPCPRCAADLSLVRATYTHARRLQHDARQALSKGRPVLALTLARQAVDHVDTPATRTTLAVALAMFRLAR